MVEKPTRSPSTWTFLFINQSFLSLFQISYLYLKRDPVNQTSTGCRFLYDLGHYLSLKIFFPTYQLGITWKKNAKKFQNKYGNMALSKGISCDVRTSPTRVDDLFALASWLIVVRYKIKPRIILIHQFLSNDERTASSDFFDFSLSHLCLNSGYGRECDTH